MYLSLKCFSNVMPHFNSSRSQLNHSFIKVTICTANGKKHNIFFCPLTLEYQMRFHGRDLPLFTININISVKYNRMTAI